jgi:dipeptidyl aminopeptidase/acylaminoacyl peptidase
MALPFDAGSAQALGDAFPVAQSVFFSNYGYAPVTGSENGLLVVLTGGATGSTQLAWFDRAGKLLDLVGAPGQINDAAISPDEKTIVFRRGRTLSGDLWLRNLSRGTDQRFTSAAGISGGPFWSPGGDRIVFNSSRSGVAYQLYQKAANGSGQDVLLFPNTNNDFPTQWSRDGHFIAYTHIDAKTLRDIWVFPVGDSGRVSTPDGKPIPFRFSTQDSMNRTVSSRPTANGWRLVRMPLDSTKSMCARFRRVMASGGFPLQAATSRAGAAMVRSCSLWQQTGR